MSQGWPGVVGTDKIRLSRADIIERFETLRSNWSGDDFPADPVPGQLHWREDGENEMYVYNADSEEWEFLVKLSSAVAGYVSPESYGAVGNGIADDKAAFLLAIATGKRVRGDPSKTYGISGDMIVSTAGNSAWVERCKFKQLNPNDTSRRTVYANGGVNVVVRDCIIDRNGDGNGGSFAGSTAAAGVFIKNVTNALVQDVEVFGNDKGYGVVVMGSSGFRGLSIHVHDIRGGDSAHATMTDDAVGGIYIDSSVGFVLLDAHIENLTTQWSGQAEWKRFTRGIALGGGSYRYTIAFPRITGTDQGIDITGGDNCRYGTIVGGNIVDPFTFGLKFANNAQFCTVLGGVYEGAGYANIICSGNAALSPQTSKILFLGVQSLAAGRATSYWRDLGIVSRGAFVQAGSSDWPREILFRDCIIDGAGGTMKYGIDNEAAIGGGGDQWVEQEGCHVSGVISGGAKYRGLHQGYTERTRSAALAVASGSWVDVDWDGVPKDGMLSTGTSIELRLLRGGVYLVTASILWDYVAGGSRMARLVRKRAGEGGFTEVPGSYQRVPPLGAGQMGVPVHALVEGNDDTRLKLQIQQDSGAPSPVNAYASAAAALLQKGTTFS